MSDNPKLKTFQNRRVLITGGMGFIGSNLAIRMIDLGAQVTIVDALIPEYGSNLFNIASVQDRVRFVQADVREMAAMAEQVRGQDYIFHLAGQVDHIIGLTNPFPDIDINITGTAVLLEACRQHNPDVRLIYSGTRGQYGPSTSLPVNERAPTNPKGIHELSCLTAEQMMRIYHEMHGIRSIMLRLTNIYGPRSQMLHSRFGVVNWFVRLAMDQQTICVYGDGSIKRDLLYIDDCIEAMLMSALTELAYGEVLNIGSGTATTLVQLAETLVRVIGMGDWQFVPYSPERAVLEPGDFYADISKIRHLVGWEPRTPLVQGLQLTAQYYQAHRHHYWMW